MTEKKGEANYIFPKFAANVLGKVDQRTQYEASMLSMFFMMIGLILSIIYIAIYLDFKLWFKIVTIINGIFGIVFMLSYLTTTFQQYRSYMEYKSLNDNMPEFKMVVPTFNNDKEVPTK